MTGWWRNGGWRDIGLIALVWLAALIIVDPRGDFPINDDWVYGLAVQAILRDHGAFSLPSPASANVALQAYWSALFCLPFGFSYTALHISTLILGFAGAVALYAAARELAVRRPIALAIALLLALNPMWFALSNSFMTDVPFAALTTISLWLLARGLKHNRPLLLALGLLAALASILIRQFGLIFVVAHGLALVVHRRGSRRMILVALAAVAIGLAGHLLFQHWLAASGRTPKTVIAGVGDAVPVLNRGMLILMFGRGMLLLTKLGALAAPAFLFTGLRAFADVRHNRWALAVFLFLILAQIWAWHAITVPTRSDIVQPWGIGPLALRDTYILAANLPPHALLAGLVAPLLMGAGIVSGALILAAFVPALAGLLQPRRAIDAALLAIVLAHAALLALLTMSVGMFDRYLLAPLPALLLWIALRAGDAPVAHGWRWAGGLLIAAYALFAIAGTHDHLAWHRARLAATDALEAAGVPPRRIDGGYEYNGRYLSRADYVERPGRSYWWVDDDLYRIASGPMPGYAIVARHPYRAWLTLSERQVVTLRRR